MVEREPTLLAIGITGVDLSIGGGLVSLVDASGLIALRATGTVAQLTGTLAEQVPGVQIGGTVSLALNTTGTNQNLSIDVGGQVPIVISGQATTDPHINAGKIRGLTIFGKERCSQ